jgi:hypothetical protein
MNFNPHWNLEGRHAFLGASKYHWIHYDEDRLIDSYRNDQNKKLGTRLHAFAAECISLGQKLPRSKKTLNLYVNDAIGFRMTPEQILYYSDNCFGTADAISFRDGILRIHDLKTGVTPAHMEQPEIYAALFCLEYDEDPYKIKMELRIYQTDEVLIHEPDPDGILDIMTKIVEFDKLIDQLAGE